MTTNFKILMYGGHYVDVNKLTGDGGYLTHKPHLYDSDHTIEKIIQTHKDIKEFANLTDQHVQNVIKNLKDCTLVDVVLDIKF